MRPPYLGLYRSCSRADREAQQHINRRTAEYEVVAKRHDKRAVVGGWHRHVSAHVEFAGG